MDEVKKLARGTKVGLQLGNTIGGVLGDVVIDRAGFRKGWQVLMYVTVWGIYLEKHGRPPETVRELADTIKTYDYSTMSRWRKAFGQAFPELDSPAPLWDQVKAAITSPAVEVAAMQAAAVEVQVA